MLTPDDILYMIVTDRFATGDATRKPPLDPSNPMGRHGGDLLGVIQRLPHLKDLGVTTLWTTPVYRNPPASYHGYHPVDFESVDPYLCSDKLGPLGDRRNVRRFIDLAHDSGLKVMLDMIVSHTAPDHPWRRDRRNWINWEGDTPDKAWFKDLPNLNHHNIDVNVYFVRSLVQWLRDTGADAVRIDAARHVETQFWDLFKAYWHTLVPNTTVAGEFWDSNPHCLAPFQNLYGFDSMFDFPLYHAIRDVFVDDYPMTRLACPRLTYGEAPGILDLDACYRNSLQLITFIGNHDTSRFFEAAGGSARPDLAAARMKLALTFLLTSRGIPQLYYGDELAMLGGFDPDNRRDMPWHLIDAAAAPADPAAARAKDMYAFTRGLTALRRRSRALRYGLTITLYLTPHFYAFARCLLDEIVIVALNNAPEPLAVTVPVRQNPRLPSLLRDRLVDGVPVTPELDPSARPELRDGALALRLPPRSSAVCRIALQNVPQLTV